MEWHIINHRDYIDGPFDTYETALREARTLGNDQRVEPQACRRVWIFISHRLRLTTGVNIGNLNTGSAPKKLLWPKGSLKRSFRSHCLKPGKAKRTVLATAPFLSPLG